MTIREAREAAGLTRREACEILKCPYRTLQDWELRDEKCTPWIAELVKRELLRHKKTK